ncbi:MAG: hypothetical protein OHK0029_21230 [Armatimonadaceae bacterium]
MKTSQNSRDKKTVSPWLLPILAFAVAVGGWGVWNNPSLQERWVSAMTLEQVAQARGERRDDVRLLYYHGLRLNEARDFAQAEPLLAQAAELSPDRAEVRREWARAQTALGNTNAAFQQLRQFVGTHPNNAEAHLLLGNFYLSVKAGKKALVELEEAVNLDPKAHEAWKSLAATRYEFSLDATKTEEAIQKALALSPDDPATNLLHARFLTKENRPEARAAFLRVLELAPEDADARQAFADYLLLKGQSEEDLHRAGAEARTALQINPELDYARFVLGSVLLQEKNASEAVRWLREAAVALPRNPAVARELAAAYRQLHQGEQAEQWQQEFVARQEYQGKRQQLMAAALTGTDNKPAYDKLSTFLATHGEVEEAIRYRALALGVVPDDPAVLSKVAEELILGGYPMTALPLAQRAAAAAPEDTQVQDALRHAQSAITGQSPATPEQP